ncbi:hypothetical protein Q5P01_000100 [Channa striata]|uniref:Uncharacterized protein n=1 Tax=Channa striata TaxID=64152 RepID=A0AA88LFE2_CHASR|nr:hypothetical protein Q5P01_000100 [Channa striata]
MPKIFSLAAVERRQLLQLLHRPSTPTQRGAHVLVLSLHHDANVQVQEHRASIAFMTRLCRTASGQAQGEGVPNCAFADTQDHSEKLELKGFHAHAFHSGNIQRPLYHAPEAIHQAPDAPSAGAPRALGARAPWPWRFHPKLPIRTACATRSAVRAPYEALSLRAPRPAPAGPEEPGSRSLLPPLKTPTTQGLEGIDGSPSNHRCLRVRRQRLGFAAASGRCREGNGDGAAVCPAAQRNAPIRGAGGEPLTDREAIRANRALMSGLADFDDEAEPTPARGEELRRDGIGMRAFWLTTYGSLVCVEEPSEDLKFRELRRDNLRTALALWTAKPELCAQGVKASSAAHAALIEMCGEASRLSRGRFYNLYARYPLPVETEEKAKAGCPAVPLAGRQPPYRRRRETPVDERSIASREIRTGAELLSELGPMYAAYLGFTEDESKHRGLSERAALLGALASPRGARLTTLFAKLSSSR